MDRIYLTRWNLLCSLAFMWHFTVSTHLHAQPEETLIRPGALAKLPPIISEASGLCPSINKDGYFWTHNDSLDQARLFLINRHGKLRQELSLAVALHADQNKQLHQENFQSSFISNVDWEACTSVLKDRYDGENVIYVADTGNNFQWRQDLKIYAFNELSEVSTEVKKQHTDSSITLSYLRAYPIRFPHSKRPPLDYWSNEGRCRDIEAMFWRQNELFLISKCIISGPTMLWRVPREQSKSNRSADRFQHQASPQDSITLEAVEKLPIKASQHPLLERVTDASYNPYLETLAVLTYQSIWFYKVEGKAKKPSFEHFVHCRLNQIPRLVRQAEAISWYQQDQNKAELLVLTEARDVYSYVLDFNLKGCVYD